MENREKKMQIEEIAGAGGGKHPGGDETNTSQVLK
jgi:hypothetical protein